MDKRLYLLQKAIKLQVFHSDCDDIERWINEKFKIINTVDYSEESIISANIAFNGIFVNELSYYWRVIDSLKPIEEEFIRENHYGVQVVRQRVKAILNAWVPLVEKTEMKILQLDDVLDSRCFLLITSKLELSLDEIAERVNRQYLLYDGKKSTKINLEKRLDLISREVSSMLTDVDTMKKFGLTLISRSHYNSENIAKTIQKLTDKYMTFISVIEQKKNSVKGARETDELCVDMEEQIAWMKEQMTSLSKIKTDLSLLEVQHLIVKHETNTPTMQVRKNEILKLRDVADKMISESHQGSIEIRKRLVELIDTSCLLTQQNEQHILKLRQSKRIYDYMAEAELNENFMLEKKSILNNNDFGNSEDSSEALLKRHQVIIDDLKAYGKEIDDLRIKAESCKVKIQDCEEQVPIEDCPVLKTQNELMKLYDDLMNLAEERRYKLENTNKAYVLLRESTELLSWIGVKQIYTEEKNVGENVEQVEILQKRFDDFQSDLAEKKIILIGILTKGEQLLPLLESDLAQLLFNKMEEMKMQMKLLQESTKKRNTQLHSAYELQRFYRDVDDVEDWIKEKNKNLENLDYGDSLERIRTLLRKHEGVERDLDALDESVEQLNETATLLVEKYPDAADKTIILQRGVNAKWKILYEKAIFRKQKLLDSHDLHKFFSDFDHLMSWILKMITVMNNIEGTSDFHSAEILKMNFQGLVSEIEAYEIQFKTINKLGEMLVDSNTNVCIEIGDKLEKLRQYHELLQETKISRKVLVDQNLEVNSFFKACENVEIWLSHKKALLKTQGENEELIKIHRRVELSISMKQKNITYLQDVSEKLINYCRLDKERIIKRLDEVLTEWQSLKDAHFTMRSELKESQTLQKFSLEAAEIEYWIDERLLQATQESYRDPVNIKSKLLKHQAFEAEISTNARRVQTMLENGIRLIECEESENLKLAVEKRLKNISNQWGILMEKTNEKSEKLKEVSKQYDHIIAIKYMNFWMGDVETKLLNQDLGRDLNAVEKLLGQNKVIEDDIEAHWEKMRTLENEANIFSADSIFDIVSIKDEHNKMISRYEKIRNLAAERRIRLNEKNTAFLLFKEIEDKETWMREIALRIEDKNQCKFKCDRYKYQH